MVDPFLHAHNVGPFHFDIGGVISPISIKDQMVRGQMIVDRAVEVGLIDQRYHLLVIGAGAAGVTAAIHASQTRNIPTTLVEMATAPFSRQRGCTSRWIDPTQYEWPLNHCYESRYPWDGPPVPLPWSRAFANILARVWMQKKLTRLPGLTVRFNTSVAGHNVIPNGSAVYVQFTSGRPGLYGAIISCIGFGAERCTVNQYSGFRFWDADDFEKPNLGLPPQEKPTVLISGGGDGALQDFLRIVTREPLQGAYDKSPRDIYESLKDFARPLPGNSNDELEVCRNDKRGKEVLLKWAEVENNLQSAEDQAQRAYIWGNKKDHDCKVQKKLHCAYVAAVDRLYEIWDEGGILNGIKARLKGWVRRPLPESVHLVYPCDHFSKCYGLNHLLVLLFAKHLEEEGNKAVHLRPGLEVLNVGPANMALHICAHKPAQCYGVDHEVSFRLRTTCNRSPGRESAREVFNVAIIRHGVNPPPGASIQFPRQIIPYFVSS